MTRHAHKSRAPLLLAQQPLDFDLGGLHATTDGRRHQRGISRPLVHSFHTQAVAYARMGSAHTQRQNCCQTDSQHALLHLRYVL
ncbi:hypothetical protein, partial [Ralstonia pseudosolanacearum]|uniref:hypothetical protein n=1 Tax=Ralstonia pseudosolanacearum TaxID=1310165 RepID=UPI003CF9BF10